MDTEELDDRLWIWGVSDRQPRILHTMIRVRNLDAALRFYGEGLGMHLLGRYDMEQGRFSIVFLSFAGFRDGPAALELTYNWDQDEHYSHGSGFGHIAIGVPDVGALYARMIEFGGTGVTPPKQMIAGSPALAFVKDPDGYSIELIQICRSRNAS